MARWPRKREFLSYYVLWKVFGEKAFNLGNALAVLAFLLGSRKVARSVFRRLVKTGFILQIKPMEYRVVSVDRVLEDMASKYFSQRLNRRGYEVISFLEKTSDGRLAIRVKGCKHSMESKINDELIISCLS